MAEPAPELALAAICRELARLGRRFALVGGLAVSVRADAQRLLQFTPTLDVSRVREHRARITERGYAREQDLEAKFSIVLRDVGRET